MTHISVSVLKKSLFKSRNFCRNTNCYLAYIRNEEIISINAKIKRYVVNNNFITIEMFSSHKLI